MTSLSSLASAPPRRIDAILVALLGTALRVAVAVWGASRFPPAEDGRFYHVVAERIASGQGYTWLWPDGAVTYAAHYPVGYPALIGMIYALFGARPVWAMSFNALLGGASVLAVHQLVAPFASRPAALLAALLVALHPGLVFYVPALMTEGVVAGLLAVVAWLVVRAARADHRRWLWLLILAVALGLTALVRPQTLLLAPLFGALAAIGVRTFNRGRTRPAVLGAALVTLLAVGACLPWTVRNCMRMERCVFVSANGGWNLLIGTFAEGRGSWVALDAAHVPAACRNVFGEADKDACFAREARRNIRADPTGWLTLVPSKLAATFDYTGAAGFYLHSSNPRAFHDADKLALGAVQLVWERVTLGLALWAAAGLGSARVRSRRAVALASLVFLLTPWAWLSYLGLCVCVALLGRELFEHPVAALAAGVVAMTALTHAVFFGAGRYSLVCVSLLSALAGLVARGRSARSAKSPSFDSSAPAG